MHSENEAVITQSSSIPGNDELPPETTETTEPIFNDNDTSSRKKQAAIWILKVQETYKLPQSTMELILKDITGFVQDLLVDLFDDVKQVLSNSGIDPAEVEGLSNLFSEDSVYATPFSGLETQYSQLKFYKEVLNFVVCIAS